ncbi:TAXI family TRAP transporter solute-binding subunit [Marinivivus vitaminiproducens]|uniref:TAXI family TRAP transporter solute-binding subunit n=1 Tax=Marinivivus vitaminiproducens TaxID=3035935 RepID=UPI0027AB41A4|nr:TAXI family TRAP transporter solute-binding subunit [Geminicoccaceae bacterium SCSIO 64248]
MALRFLLSVIAALAVGSAALAQQPVFFRIGTGGVSGTYYPIGGVIANVISNPPGSRDCAVGGSCGVPGLAAVVQSSAGSVENIEGIADGSLESGFAQADVAYWAYSGTGLFQDRPAMGDLRVLANLYRETVHVVARRDAGIASIDDLRGKRVSLDEEGSGTLADARILLAAFGLNESDLQVVPAAPDEAIDLMTSGELDAFVLIAGYPASSVAELARNQELTLVPITGPVADRLVGDYPFFQKDVIPSDVYAGAGATPTLSVGAQWLVDARLPDDLGYALVEALWHPSNRKLLDNSHPRARDIRPERALEGLAIPLHPGAERYYREAGLLTSDRAVPPQPAGTPPQPPRP